MLDVTLKQESPILLDARIACAPGSLLALVGPSGAGKTTILRAIAGLTRVREARITVATEVWEDTATNCRVDPRARPVGMVFQSYALFPHLSVLENVAEGVQGVARNERRARARRALDRVNLAGFEARRPAQLSGGQQQRVALARALVREPKVLLLDEPFAAVDQVTRERLYEELAELRLGLNIPVVLVTHSLVEAQLLADRMIVLRRGKTLQDGATEAVLTRPASEDVARMVGFGNLFDSTVIAANARDATIEFAHAQIALPAVGAKIGEKVHWGIAAGDVVLIKEGRAAEDPTHVVTLTLERATLLGENVRLILAAGDTRLRAVVTKRFFERATLQSGQSVRVELPIDKLVVFDNGSR